MDGKRRVWGLIFLASGLITMTAVLASLISAAALPYAAISGVVTVCAGYRIWKAAHPEASFWRELSRRTVAVIGVGATVAALLFASAYPQVVLVIVGIWLAVVVAIFTWLAKAERTSR